MVDSLILTVVTTTMVAFVHHSATGGDPGESLSGAFGNQQLLAAFLLLLMPLMVAVATAARKPLRRTLGQVAAVLALAALVVAYAVGRVQIGPYGWAIIAGTTVIGNALIWWGSERLLCKFART